MRYLKIGKIAKLLGVTPQTIRNWYKSGKIEGVRTNSGRLLFPESVLVANSNKIKKINVGYCRVSSRHQKDDLERQGWVKQTTYDEPRLSEMIEMYREMGFEVHIEAFESDDESGCSQCMISQPERYKTIYTRKRGQS